MTRLFAVFLAILGGPLGAQVIDGPMVGAATPAGPARVETTAQGPTLVIGDTPIDLGRAASIGIAGQRGALLLVQIAAGGRACPAEYVWVHAFPGALQVTGRFGTCSDLPVITSDATSLTVTLPSMAAEGGHVAFVYDGQGPVQEVALPAAFDSWAEAEIGADPALALSRADWADRVQAVAGPEGLLAAERILITATPFEARGDWVIGHGCVRPTCAGPQAILAANRADGRVVLVLSEGQRPPRILGVPDRALEGLIAQTLQAEL